MPSRRHNSAMLTCPLISSITILIFYSDEYFLRVCLLISLILASALCFFTLIFELFMVINLRILSLKSYTNLSKLG